MQCQRCLKNEEAHYRVRSDSMNMAVCDTCADEARQLGLAVHAYRVFDSEKEGSSPEAKIADQGSIAEALVRPVSFGR